MLQLPDIHTAALAACMVILFAAFAVMFYSVFAHRRVRSAGVGRQWHEHTLVELLWTVIPVLILFGSAWPATRNVLAANQKSSPILRLAEPSAASPVAGVHVAAISSRIQAADKRP